MKTIKWICMFTILSLHMASIHAKPPVSVPDALKPWVDWVLYGQESVLDGIPAYNNSARVQCIWPSELSLDVTGTGGVFTQDWVVNCESWVTLPGTDPYWPDAVRVDGTPGVMLKRNNLPAIRLKKGAHRITGTLHWNKLPEYLPIPGSTALISLKINGKPIEYPRLDDQGRLWFQVQRQTEETIENRLTLQTYRLLSDQIPPVMTVFLKLDVSGAAREVTLGPIFSKDEFVPLSLNSDLPARVDQDGRLVVQLRPGQWTLTLKARHLGPLTALTFTQPDDGYWPDQSIWSFQSQNQLRIVEISGVTAIDPQQTSLPSSWRKFPAYRMTPGNTMTFQELKRGDADPAPDQLSLHRKIWLRFDGSGYTFQDQISGNKNSDWRLEMNPPIKLGKVEMDGVIQFITQRENTNKTGVELRSGALNLTVDSEFNSSSRTLPLTGWDQTFQSVSTTLSLPPGYRLIHAFGIDNVPDTWITRWNLLDLFFVLFFTAAVARLFSKKTALLAFLTLGLLHHEPGAPLWIWLAVLGGTALLKYLPSGQFKRTIQVYQIFAAIILAIISITFAVSHLRVGIYPQLERRFDSYAGIDMLSRKMPAPAPMSGTFGMNQNAMDEAGEGIQENKYDTTVQTRRSPKKYKSLSQVAQYDPRMLNQTGPGLPEWEWNSVRMTSGPTEPGQEITFIMTGPKVNLILAFVRVALLAMLALALLGIGYRKKSGWTAPGIHALVAKSVILAFLLLPAVALGSDIPSPQLLTELQNRLLQKDDCFPDCADVSSMAIRITPEHLNITLQINSQIDTAIPLPGNQKHWLPGEILMDQKRLSALFRQNGMFWVMVPEGRHTLLLKGKLPGYNTIQLPLPMKPGKVDVNAEGWSVEGLRDNGFVDNQLQFKRITTEAKTAMQILETGVMPPFVSVERTLRLGLDWRIETIVQRRTPMDSAIVLELPLLQGESVITEGVEVKNGIARVNLDASTDQIGWESILEPSDEIVLKHAETNLWTETWQVDVSPILHMTYDGIPVIMEKYGSRWLPQWHPWPGEEVTLTITRPKGVKGQTLTIQKSKMVVIPGKRVTDCDLTMTLQSSQGMQHSIRVPEGTQVQEIRMDNVTQPIRQEGRSIPLTITPGTHNIQIKWRESRGVSAKYDTSQIDLGIRSVNTSIEVRFPQNRWILWVYGPQLGPALLFYSILIVLLLASFALSRTGMTPLKFHHWFLLGLGMSQGGLPGIIIVVIWLLVLHFRSKVKGDINHRLFDLMQLAIVILTGIALTALLVAIGEGLLGRPDMNITGNGSYGSVLKWYQDSSAQILPVAGVISIPMFLYRIAMLLWALWTAFYLMNVLKWAWTRFSQPTFWRPFFTKKKVQKP